MHVDNAILYLQLRREAGWNTSYSVFSIPFNSKIIVFRHFVFVRRPVNLEKFHIVRLESDGYVIRWWEECPVKALKQIFFQIWHFHCTEVVEALYIVQFLAGWRTEFIRNADDRNVDIVVAHAFDEVELSRQRIVAHVGQHHQSILAARLSFCGVGQIVLESLHALVEARRQRGASACLDVVDHGEDGLNLEVLLHRDRNDGLAFIVEDD